MYDYRIVTRKEEFISKGSTLSPEYITNALSHSSLYSFIQIGDMIFKVGDICRIELLNGESEC